MNIYERVRKAQAAAEAARKGAEYKAGEHARRSHAARVAAEIRRETRDDAICAGLTEPRNAREADLQMRACYGWED